MDLARVAFEETGCWLIGERNVHAEENCKSLVLLPLALLLAAGAKAQTSSGILVGTAMDDTGAAIPNATITVKSLGTGEQRTCTRTAAANSRLPTCRLITTPSRSRMKGSQKAFLPDTEVEVGQRSTINPVLHTGTVESKVTVLVSVTPLLNQASSSVGQVMDTKTVQNVPLNGRNFWQLTQLTPGVSYIQGGQNIATRGTSIPASAVNVNVNGLSPSWTGWYLDGANITEFHLGGTIIQPNVDALQEFKVESSNMGAEYGHSLTIVNATLKSGSNELHATVYELLRNNALDAKNYFFLPPAGSDARNQALHRNQFGLAVGGPIVRNRTFFFVDLQGTLYSLAESFNSVVATDAERTGDFSFSGETIKNPLTGMQANDGRGPQYLHPDASGGVPAAIHASC